MSRENREIPLEILQGAEIRQLFSNRTNRARRQQC